MKTCAFRYYKPICHTKEGLLLYHREKLFLMPEGQLEPAFLCDLPIEEPRGKFCVTPLMERLMHVDVYCGIEAPGGAVVVFNKGIYYVDFQQRTTCREHSFAAPGMRRPFNFYEIRGILGFPEGLYYGEYSYNGDHGPVSIFRRREDGSWIPVYAFPAHTIRHIHCIVPDHYRNRVIICTGDNGEEAAIWAAYDNFSRVEKLFGGDQVYRVCCARAYPEGILLVTDSPHFQNYAYLLTEENGTICREELCLLPGPTVFFTEHGSDVVFATDVEYDERRLNGFTKYVTYRRGPGVQDWFSHVFKGNPSTGFHEIARFRKDWFPMGAAFGFGGTCFPNGQVPGRLYLYPYAVEKDRRLCIIDLPD